MNSDLEFVHDVYKLIETTNIHLTVQIGMHVKSIRITHQQKMPEMKYHMKTPAASCTAPVVTLNSSSSEMLL